MTDMTLEGLEEILRREEESENLTELGHEFFPSVAHLLERLASPDDFFLQKKREVAERCMEEIVTLRAHKVLTGKSDKTLPEEHKLIKLSGEITTKKAEIVAELLSPSKEVEIRVTKSIPQFTGPDMKMYGPYDSGQVITLSAKISSLLLSHGYVEKVSET